ncbi:unnamed protein product [Sphagnum jensenii]|uniref:Amine oxidase domain-containing protein n=1 Tax=Sphagnum jensenii TaxID=128206 RepID=A0ABP0XIY8_9BRYO
MPICNWICHTAVGVRRSQRSFSLLDSIVFELSPPHSRRRRRFMPFCNWMCHTAVISGKCQRSLSFLEGYKVTLLEAGAQPGGLVAGWKTASGRSVEVGIHGFWYPYQNIFSLVDELGLEPFTTWTRSTQYSPNGLEVESPIFQALPQLPSPLGTFVYTQVMPLALLCSGFHEPLY